MAQFLIDSVIEEDRILWDYDPKRFERAELFQGTIRDNQKFILRN